jgi:hypothetical protein
MGNLQNPNAQYIPKLHIMITVLLEILAARVFGSSKIPEKKRIQKMLDLVANTRRSLDIL